MYTFNLNVGLDYLSIFVSRIERSWSAHAYRAYMLTARISALRINNICLVSRIACMQTKLDRSLACYNIVRKDVLEFLSLK